MEKLYVYEKDGRKSEGIEVICGYCGEKFIKRKRFIERSKNHYCSLQCRSNDRKKRVKVICYCCGKELERTESELKRSKSGLYFCSRKCKDESQRIGGCKEIMPSHYGLGNGKWTYRQRAFDEYLHKCSNCGWSFDERVLEVHHIDGNRDNNDIENLIIMCPTCHRSITLGYAMINENREFMWT